jgi:lipopolysaccharide transport system permease protein
VAFAILIVLMAVYGITPTVNVLCVPLFSLLALLAAIGVGLWFAALNVKYRDVRHAVPLLVQVWLFATPIAYPSSLVPAAWRWAYGLNPMAGVVEGFRWALLGTPAPSFGMIAVSTAVTIVALFGGLVYFRRAERGFADLI